jgi:hypothetical protein
MRGLTILCAAFGATALATTANAQSLTGNVGSAAITQGERGIEARVGFNDNGDAGARVHFDYGFTDWYQLRTIASFSQPDGGDWAYSALTLENWFQWREEGSDGSGFNGGLRVAYSFQDGGGPDEAEVRLTLTDRFAGDWEWRANVIGEIETGDGSEGGVALESRAQVTRAIPLPPFSQGRLGLELLSEYGTTRDVLALEDQAHQVGPVLKAEWGDGLYLQSAVRFGLTEATDDMMFKLFFGREF